MHYAWSAPVLPLLRTENMSLPITRIDEIWLEGTYLIAGLAGLPLTMYFVDKIGRKNSVWVASIANLLSWVLIAAAKKIEILYFGRILAGAAGDMSYVAIPMYLSEISSEHYRGLLTSLSFDMVLIGTLVIAATAPFTCYFVPPAIGIFLLAVQLSIFPLMPESPYFLLSKGQEKEAKIALQRVRANEDNTEDEFHKIAEVVARQILQTKNFKDLLLVRSNRKVVIIITILIACQFFSGFSAIVMNFHTILLDADTGHYMNVEANGIIFFLLMVISATFCCLTVDKFGKKILLVTSSALTGICLLIISIYFHLYKYGYRIENLSWVPACAIMAYAITYKLGMGFLPQVIVSELFPNNVKAYGMAYGDFLFIVFSSVSLIFYQYLDYFYGHYVPMYVFSVTSFVGAFYTYYYVPETKGKTLDQIQIMLQEL